MFLIDHTLKMCTLLQKVEGNGIRPCILNFSLNLHTDYILICLQGGYRKFPLVCKDITRPVFHLEEYISHFSFSTDHV